MTIARTITFRYGAETSKKNYKAKPPFRVGDKEVRKYEEADRIARKLNEKTGENVEVLDDNDVVVFSIRHKTLDQTEQKSEIKEARTREMRDRERQQRRDKPTERFNRIEEESEDDEQMQGPPRKHK